MTSFSEVVVCARTGMAMMAQRPKTTAGTGRLVLDRYSQRVRIVIAKLPFPLDIGPGGKVS